MNPIAQVLTGCQEAEARGRDLIDVFPIVNETGSRSPRKSRGQGDRIGHDRGAR